ncbi:MAG: group II intron reverse transcriptase/maturase [Chlamydiae bacterium]|nr:group II intron reverse transcriptase/maturase [Chlamydiota bacterium]
MSVEQRSRQDLNLNPCTSLAHRGKNEKHKGKHEQLSMFPHPWERIGSRAKDKEAIFNNLLFHINVESLREAYNALDGSKALGIDGISKAEYGKNLSQSLGDLATKIQRGSYKPQPKREKLIPKGNGKTRPIAIGCFEDKLVEWCVHKILECIYEPLFIRNSFGFRPNRSAHGAIKAVYYSLKDNRRPFVVEIDFSNFFNTIPHGKMMKVLKEKITDRRFKGLVGRFLKCGILRESGLMTPSEVGTPQGSVMSPMLANIYLHEVLDRWFLENHASYNNIVVRYADDAVFFFKKEETSTEFVKALTDRVTMYGLTLNQEKTKVVNFHREENNHFHFLSFTFYWGKKRRCRTRQLKLKTQKEKLIRMEPLCHILNRNKS